MEAHDATCRLDHRGDPLGRSKMVAHRESRAALIDPDAIHARQYRAGLAGACPYASRWSQLRATVGASSSASARRRRVPR
jgi:hypothetical protein